MKQAAENLLNRITPYIGMGILVALFIIGLIIFSYVIVIGAIIGLIFFAIAYIRSKFAAKKPQRLHKKTHRGRTIEHNNFK